ncbi:MAG: YbaK/EbsC family protein [Nanoarchaeota archaeon]
MEKASTIKNYLNNLNISFKVHSHPAVYTCEEAENLCKNILGIHSKNLFLKSKKDKEQNFYLAILPENKKLDIKTLEKKLNNKLKFASDEDLNTILNIKTGAVSPFALINDKEGKVILLIDREVLASDIVSFHPNINTETLELSNKEFHRYLTSLKNKRIEI